MSDDTIDNGTDKGAREARYVKQKEAAKELAKKIRKQAYERAKAYSKAQKIERANTPEAEARKLRLREQRRQAYLKAKDAYKSRVAERKRSDKEREAREDVEARALRDTGLLATLKKSDDVVAAPRPKLRLVKSED